MLILLAYFGIISSNMYTEIQITVTDSAIAIG